MVAYSFKRRFVAPIRLGLGKPDPEAIFRSPGMIPKRQTIRAVGKRRHARPGETLQLYHGMRSQDCFKIGDGRCVGVDDIEITVRDHQMPITLAGAAIIGGFIQEFARADGFDSAEDMHAFWKEEHGLGVFVGFVIRWEPLT